MENTLNIVLLVLLLAAVIVLQAYLSRRPDRRLGWILPGVSLVVSIIGALMMYTPPDATASEVILSVLLAFVYWNIPTLALILIYLISRRGMHRQQVNRMRVQDL